MMLTDRDYSNILCAAFEGGINYWADIIVPNWPAFASFNSEVPMLGKNVVLRTENGDEYILNKDKWIAGVRKAANHWNLSLEDFLDDHDAEMADVAVQYAIFGDVIYG